MLRDQSNVKTHGAKIYPNFVNPCIKQKRRKKSERWKNGENECLCTCVYVFERLENNV